MTWDKRKPRPGPGKVMVENLKEMEHAPLVSIPFHSGLCFTRLFWKWGMQVSNTWLSWAGQRLKYHNLQCKYSRNWSKATMKRLRKRSTLQDLWFWTTICNTDLISLHIYSFVNSFVHWFLYSCIHLTIILFHTQTFLKDMTKINVFDFPNGNNFLKILESVA